MFHLSLLKLKSNPTISSSCCLTLEVVFTFPTILKFCWRYWRSQDQSHATVLCDLPSWCFSGSLIWDSCWGSLFKSVPPKQGSQKMQRRVILPPLSTNNSFELSPRVTVYCQTGSEPGALCSQRRDLHMWGWVALSSFCHIYNIDILESREREKRVNTTNLGQAKAWCDGKICVSVYYQLNLKVQSLNQVERGSEYPGFEYFMKYSKSGEKCFIDTLLMISVPNGPPSCLPAEGSSGCSLLLDICCFLHCLRGSSGTWFRAVELMENLRVGTAEFKVRMLAAFYASPCSLLWKTG